MGLPKSVVRFKNGNVEYVSNVDAAKYSIQELTRAALRDVGKYVTRLCRDQASKLYGGGLEKTNRILINHRKPGPAFQYWARKKECDLQVGIDHDTWYGVDQELGTSNVRKHGILRNTVYNNIPTIIEIESKYLSALEEDAEILNQMINEEDYASVNDEEQ